MLCIVNKVIPAKAGIQPLCCPALLSSHQCNQSADAALAQIHDKGYAQAYQGLGKKVTLLGINFDTEKHNVGEWRVTDVLTDLIQPAG